MSKPASVLQFLAYFLILLVLGCSSPTSSFDSGSAIRTLVLGSGGFLGQRLVEHLEQRGHSVAQVTGREHVDLRSQTALRDFEKREGPFDFVFFIACEVGGAKFLEKEQSQPAILRHNVQMYESVFPWAKEQGIPLLFTSSYMRFAPGVYGAVKLLGEEYLTALLPPSLGRAVRLWNLYGPEPVSQRSHVISDWAAQCVRGQAIASTTDGLERRQFLHVDDAAAALVSLYEHWGEAYTENSDANAAADAEPMIAGSLASVDTASVACDSAGSCASASATGGQHSNTSSASAAMLSDSARRSFDAASGLAQRRVIDLSSGSWHSLRDVAALMSTVAVEDLGLPPCPLTPAPKPAPPRPEVDPDRTSRLHASWQEWMAPDRYPIGAPVSPALRHAAAPTPAVANTTAAAPDADGFVVLALPAGGLGTASGSSSGSGSGDADARSGDFGWIALRDGIAHVLRHHMALLARERNDAAAGGESVQA